MPAREHADVGPGLADPERGLSSVAAAFRRAEPYMAASSTLMGSVAGFTALGYGLDRWLGHDVQWLLLTGSVIGIGVGFLGFFRKVLRADAGRRADAPPARYGSWDAYENARRVAGAPPCKDGVMWNPASPTRSAVAFSMAAAVAFLGSAMLLKAGRAFPRLAGGAPDGGQPGTLLLAVVILLVVTGVLLAAMAARELLDHRRRAHAR